MSFTTYKVQDNGTLADELIAAEIAKQDAMWGTSNERADVSKRQLMHAAAAQIYALEARYRGYIDAFTQPPVMYPEGWTGFRDYGSNVANLVVAAAYLRQEIKRLISLGESTERKARDVKTQPYTGDKPAVQF